MKNKLVLFGGLLLILVFVAGFLLGKRTVPGSAPQVDQSKKNVVTTIKEIVQPSGAKQIETVIVDRSQDVSSKPVQIIKPAPVVIVSATAEVDYKDLRPTYGILLQKPIFGSKLLVGAGVNTKGEVSATVGWSF